MKIKEKSLISDMKRKGDLARQMMIEKDEIIQQLMLTNKNNSNSNNGNSNNSNNSNNGNSGNNQDDNNSNSYITTTALSSSSNSNGAIMNTSAPSSSTTATATSAGTGTGSSTTATNNTATSPHTRQLTPGKGEKENSPLLPSNTPPPLSLPQTADRYLTTPLKSVPGLSVSTRHEHVQTPPFFFCFSK